MRFVHTADWQLGMTRRFLGAGRPGQAAGEAQARFAQARLDAVAALGRVAADEGAAFVVVCGDVFESNLVGPDVVGRACEALRTFTVPVLLLPGNHDPADAALVMRRADFARRVPAAGHGARPAGGPRGGARHRGRRRAVDARSARSPTSWPTSCARSSPRRPASCGCWRGTARSTCSAPTRTIPR